MKLGRPTGYRLKYGELAKAAGREGASISQIADEIGVSRWTLYRWEARYPEFGEAMQAARDWSQAWWERRANEYMIDPQAHPLNARLWLIEMARRFPREYRRS